MAKSKRKPYSSISDEEKVKKNWKKARGLFSRGEYSVAVLRCGTCIELAVNFSIRKELRDKRNLPDQFVETLLKNANGLTNKYRKILLPVMKDHIAYKDLNALWENHIVIINKNRNSIIHSGEFRKRSTAKKIVAHTEETLKNIMKLYGCDGLIEPFRDDRP